MAWSLPSRGAWIEMPKHSYPGRPQGSLPSRGAWIEIYCMNYNNFTKVSLPSRGAWIEIVLMLRSLTSGSVAPLTGSVD